MKNLPFLILFIIAFFNFSCETQNQNGKILVSKEVIIDTSVSSCPFITKDNNNHIVLSWIRQRDTSSNVFCFAISQDEGKTFAKPVEIPGSENVKPHGENMPKVIFKPSGEIIAVWGAGNPNPKNAYSGQVYYAQSFNKGKTWTKPLPLVNDTASYDQRYFDLAILPNGEAAIIWLDNRKTLQKEGSGLYYAVTNGNSGFQSEKLISEPCCQCCRTDLFIDSKKNIHALYRAIINDSIRDMVHITSTDGGYSFSRPIKISNDNWVINGCPHTGPAMAENEKGMHFAWFTAGGGSGIYYNNTHDNGHTYSERDTVSGKTAKHSQIITLSNDKILIVWNEGFTIDNKVSNRIGIEQRDAEGKSILKQYITSETSQASYPVIKPVNEKTALIAYTQSINERDYIFYQLVTIP